jgi:hypothetical protein
VCRGADCKCIEEVDYVLHHTPTSPSNYSVPTRLCAGDGEEYESLYDIESDNGLYPDVIGI